MCCHCFITLLREMEPWNPFPIFFCECKCDDEAEMRRDDSLEFSLEFLNYTFPSFSSKEVCSTMHGLRYVATRAEDGIV